MKIFPFLSRKTKKVLQKNEDRIILKTKEEQDLILKDPKIKVEDKLKQVLKENNELKVLFDDLQGQLSKDIRAGGSYVFSISHGVVELISDIKVLQDNKLQLAKNRKVDIKEQSWVGKIKTGFRTKQFRVWFVESEGEYTFDPRDLTQIEIKKKNEMQLQLGQTAAEKNIGEALINDLGSKVKKWWEVLGPSIIIFAVAFSFLLFMGMFFGQYNLVKA